MMYLTKIHKALMRLGTNGTENPEAGANSKEAKALGELFLWAEVTKFAESKKKEAQAALDVICPVPQEPAPGTHNLGESSHFMYNVDVSKPVVRFDEDELVELLSKSKYKIPAPIARDFVDKARVPGKPKVTRKVIERA